MRWNFYVRDEWRVNSKLTLNFGLHYEINTPFTEVNDQWVNFDPATGKQLLAGQNGVEPHRQTSTRIITPGRRASASPISSTGRPSFAAATGSSIFRKGTRAPTSASSGSLRSTSS